MGSRWNNHEFAEDPQTTLLMRPFQSMRENADATVLFARLCAFSISFCFEIGANYGSPSNRFNETDSPFDFFDYFKYGRAQMIR
jgi:hypothetical protein